MLEITSDQPVASVKVNGRPNALEVPTTKVSIELEPDDEGKDIKVVATAADGRVTTGVAKDNAVTLSFANAVVPPAPAPAPKGPPPKGPRKKR
jgi:hypothetical protein